MCRSRLLFGLICVLLMAGCAPTESQLKLRADAQQNLFKKKLSNLEKKPIVMFTITDEIDDSMEYKGGLWSQVLLISKNDDEKDFKKHKVFEPSDYFCPYILNKPFILLDIEPGDYFLYSIRGKIITTWRSPLFEAPILLHFQAKANEIVYIGNIHLKLRKKSSDEEPSAGPIMPLFDQTAVNDGTFDVEIKDVYEDDINRFESVFTNLKGQNLVKRILPSWTKPSPQEFEPKKTHYMFY